MLVTVSLAIASSGARAGAPLYIPPSQPEGQKKPEDPKPAPTTTTTPPAAVKPAAVGRARVLVMDLKASEVPPTTVETVTNIIVSGLSTYETLDVISGEDVKKLVELEATRTTMGCNEDASCLAEIAGALGAQLVVFGAVGKLGDATVITLNLFDSQKAQALGRVSTQSKHIDRLPKRVAAKLHELVAPYHESNNLVMPPPPPPEETGPGALPWITAGAGAIVAAGGAAAAVLVALPLLDYNDARGRVVAAEGRFPNDNAAAVDAAKIAQSDLTSARNAYNSYGFLALDGGVALVAVGIATAGAGIAWAVAASQDDDPDIGGAAAAPAASTATTGGAQ